jgi:hypothetical protein
MRPQLVAAFLAVCTAACAADREFDRVVSAVEHHYNVKRTHIPLMGLANLFVKVAHPAGTSGFKLAVFEDLPEPTFEDVAALDRFMEGVRGRLHPMVVTRSRRDGEASYIYAGEVGKSTELLIATFERHEATVIEVTVNMETLLKMIGSPDHAHRLFDERHDSDHDTHDDGK